MKRITLLRTTAGLIILAGCLAPGPVSAIEVAGGSFAERYWPEQTELRLAGTAVQRWALLFDVYAGAFSLPPGV